MRHFIGTMFCVFLGAGWAFGQYTCKQAPCISVGSQGWVVGEIKTFAFGEDSKNKIMTELAARGWIECAGQTLPRNAYKALFNAIGDTWGSADGKTDFFVPDLRGQFIRSWNHGTSEPKTAAYGGDPEAKSRQQPRSVSPGGVGGNSGDFVGSIQPGLVGDHTHDVVGYGGKYQLHNQEFGNGIGGLYNYANATFSTGSVSGDHAENRPHNVYVLYAIYAGVPSSLKASPKIKPIQ